jgi:hypothetical protein
MIVEHVQQELGLSFDGGFEFEYLSGNQVQITSIWDAKGNTCRVSRSLYRQFCDYARACLAGYQEMVDGLMFEAQNDL